MLLSAEHAVPLLVKFPVLNMNPEAQDVWAAALEVDLKIVQRRDGRHAYNLADDPGETADIMARSDEIAALHRALDRFAGRVSAVRRGQPIDTAPAIVTRIEPEPRMQ